MPEYTKRRKRLLLAKGRSLSFLEGPHKGKLPQTKEGRNSTVGETQVEKTMKMLLRKGHYSGVGNCPKQRKAGTQPWASTIGKQRRRPCKRVTILEGGAAPKEGRQKLHGG